MNAYRTIPTSTTIDTIASAFASSGPWTCAAAGAAVSTVKPHSVKLFMHFPALQQFGGFTPQLTYDTEQSAFWVATLFPLQ